MPWDDGLNPRQVNALRESYQRWPTLTPQVEKKLIRWGLLSEQIRNAYQFFRSEVTAEEIAKRKASKEMLVKIMKQQKQKAPESDSEIQESKTITSNFAVVKKPISVSCRDVTKEDVENIIRIIELQSSEQGAVKKPNALIKSEPVETTSPKGNVKKSPVELRDKRERRVPKKRSARVPQTSEPPTKKFHKEPMLKNVKIEVSDDVEQVDAHQVQVKMEIVESPNTSDPSTPKNCAPIQNGPIRPQCSYEMPELPMQLIPQDSRPFTVSSNSAFAPYKKPIAPEHVFPPLQPQFPLLSDASQMGHLQMPQLFGYQQMTVLAPVPTLPPLLVAPANGLVDLENQIIPQIPTAINIFDIAGVTINSH